MDGARAYRFLSLCVEFCRFARYEENPLARYSLPTCLSQHDPNPEALSCGDQMRRWMEGKSSQTFTPQK